MEGEVGNYNTFYKDGGYFFTKGVGAMLTYTENLKKGVASCRHTKLYKQLLE